jgi:hypothetical protein
LRQRIDGEVEHLISVGCTTQASCEIANGASTSLTEHRRRGLRYRMEDASNAAAFIADGGERKSEKGFLEVAVAGEEHALILEIRGLACESARERLADRRPCAFPSDVIALTQCTGVRLAAHDTIAVVIDLGVLGPPDDIDREIGSQAKTDRGAQTLWPSLSRAEWGLGPIGGANELRHFTYAVEEAAPCVSRTRRCHAVRGLLIDVDSGMLSGFSSHAIRGCCTPQLKRHDLSC